ncbi:hypothetical protein M153_21530001453, partial [Pseudoloma neurophilia]
MSSFEGSALYEAKDKVTNHYFRPTENSAVIQPEKNSKKRKFEEPTLYQYNSINTIGSDCSRPLDLGTIGRMTKSSDLETDPHNQVKNHILPVVSNVEPLDLSMKAQNGLNYNRLPLSTQIQSPVDPSRSSISNAQSSSSNGLLRLHTRNHEGASMSNHTFVEHEQYNGVYSQNFDNSYHINHDLDALKFNRPFQQISASGHSLLGHNDFENKIKKNIQIDQNQPGLYQNAQAQHGLLQSPSVQPGLYQNAQAQH